MNETCLFIIIVLLFYIINEMKKSQKAQEKPKESFRQALPQFRGKMCEITLEEPLVMIDAVFSVKGILVDAWVMMETISRKKKLTKVFRIDNISGINEIPHTIY